MLWITKIISYDVSLCFIVYKFGLVCHVGEDLKRALKAKWCIPITNNDEFFNALMELAPTKQMAVSVTWIGERKGKWQLELCSLPN